jgi:hypothetical protein
MLAFLFTGLMATAAIPIDLHPPQVSGHYLIRGDYEITSHIRQEVVHSQTQAGKDRLNALRAQGYTCQLTVNSTWACQTFLHDDTRFPAMDQYVQRKWLSHGFVFHASDEEHMEQTNDSEYLKEWTAQQTVAHVLPDGTIDARWTMVDYDWVQGLWKIYLGLAGEENTYYFLWADDKLIKPDQVRFKNGAVTDKYMIEIQMELARP